MAQYDGSIRINTEIEAKQAEKELKSLESSISKTAEKIASLRSKMDALKDVQIPTQEYKEIESDIAKAERELQRLVEKQSQMQREGKDSGAAWDILNQKIQATKDYIEFAKEDMQQLVDAGKAFTLGSDTEKYAEMSAQMEDLTQQMQSDTERQAELQDQIAEREEHLADLREKAVVGNQQIIKTVERIKQLEQEIADLKAAGITEGYSDYDSRVKELSKLKQEVKDYNSNLDKVKESYKRIGKAAKDGANVANKAVKSMNDSFKVGLKNILKYGLGIRSLFVLINKLRAAIKEGFTNLYNDSGMGSFKNTVDSLNVSLLTLKNSFAAAFRPLVEIAIPYIQKVIDYMSRLLNMIAQFTAAIRGQKTYTRAIKQTTDAIKDQNKAQNKQLSNLDNLNNLTSGKGGVEDGGAAQMFEEVPIDTKILDFLQKLKDFLKPIIDYAQKLKDVFMQGFWDGLGDWEYRWNSIKDSLKSIKDSLIDIWTDPAVLAAADAWAQSVAYMLGSLVGSLASIGLTIATNLIGGLAKYLEENKDRIKDYLISMFNIWTEINQMFAELFQSIAYVFEAFASEQGQQLTANIIGIFSDAFMSVTELASKAFRDIANIFIQPFVDNKEAFRTALEGFLGVLAEVTGTIKQGIDDTFDKLNEVYDAHFKPFFDSIAQGLSDLVGQFMEFWNGNVQTILDQWAADFDALWAAHIQPLLDNAAEFLGKIADLLKVVWENYLQPMIAWIIANVLPKILPVLQSIWDTLKNLVGYIADAISNVITILGGLIDFITGVLSGDWEKAFQGLQDVVSGFADLIKSIIEGALQFISDIFKSSFEAIKAVVDSILQAIKSIVKSTINYIKQNITGKLNEIKSRFSDFKANATQIWVNMWNGLKEKVKSIIDGIKSIVKGAFDWISQKISSIGSAFGSFKSKASGLFGGGSGANTEARTSSTASTYALNPAFAALATADIPGYATGQVIPTSIKKHLAYLGDNNRETEVVSPLSTIEEAVINAMAKVNGNSNNNGGNVTVEIPVILNGNEIGRAMQQFSSEFFKQNGKPAFT